MKYSKIKIMLLVGVCCLFMFAIWGFCGAIFFVIKHVSITDAEPFPEWNQKDIDYLQQLTGVKLPPETVLLEYSNHEEQVSHDVSWFIFSKRKIIFPYPLTDNIMSAEWERNAFIRQCRVRRLQSNFSIEDEIQSNLAAYKVYNGKGHDEFVEMKTSNGYYVRIQYCRILPRNSKEQKNAANRE